MVHLTDPLLSPYSTELDKFEVEKRGFLGLHIEDETMNKIAYGVIDPISLIPFKDDENEKYLVQRALGNKSRP